MKYQLIFIFMFIFKAVFSQHSFELTFGNDNEEMIFCIKEIGDNYYVGQTYSYESQSYWRFAELVKLNKHGTIVDSLRRDTTNEIYSDIRDIVPLNESEMLLIGSNRSNSAEFSSIWIVKIDTLLNVIWERKFETNKPLVSKIVTTRNKYGNIIIGSTLSTSSPYFYQNIYLLEINTAGDTLRSNYIDSGDPIYTDLQSLITNCDEYRAFVMGFENNYTSFTNVLVIDSTLNIRDIKPIPDGIDHYLTAQSINDTTYHLTGTKNNQQYSADIYTAKYDTTGAVLFNNTYGSGVQIRDVTAWVKSMSTVSNNSLYVGGIQNENWNFYYCNLASRKKVILINYDSLLNTNWVKTYANDTACYSLSVIEATKDGGCIFGGMLYTPIRPEKKLDNFIIKVDSLGLITHNKAPKKEKFIINIYPNPGCSYLRISSTQNYSGQLFRLYNLHGILEKELLLKSDDEYVNTENLLTGCYFWTVTSKEQVTNGKWIKTK